MDKPNYEFVKKHFEEQKCVLLEDKYINNLTKMEYLCNCGNKSSVSWSNFKKGNRCKKCSNNKRKPTYEFVKNEFKKAGCILLENKYTDGKTKMEFICECGNKSYICWSNFRRHGGRCKQCRIKRTTDSNRFTHDFVKSYFEKHNCILLSEYKNSRTKVEYICSCGEKAITIWSRFSNGSRCKNCFAKRRHRNPNREIVQLNYNLSERCISMIRRILKATNDKQTETMKLLNYTTEELRIRLTSHPNWNNIKDKKWAIDHVFPINAFVKNNILDIKLINCLENLRPITSSENFSKNARYNQEDFVYWLKTKGIDII